MLVVGCWFLRVIGLCDAWMQQSTIIFTDKSSTSRVQIPSFGIVKAKLGLNNVYVLADSNNEICPLVDLSDTIPFPFIFPSIPLIRDYQNHIEIRKHLHTPPLYAK